MVQNWGQLIDKGPELLTLSYHVLKYGVLTARGIAAGKRVCTGPCARTRDIKSGRRER